MGSPGAGAVRVWPARSRRRLVDSPDGFEEVDQLDDFGVGEMVDLFAVQIKHGFVEVFQNAEAFGSNAGGDHAAVLGVAVTGDEDSCLKAVEEAGDVGIAGDQVFADAFAGHAAVAGAAEDSEDVVLGGREVVGFEEFFEGAHKVVRGADEIEE